MASDKKTRKKVLLIEDNREMLELITYFLNLRDSRLDVIGSMSAEQGMLELVNVDLLVVDLRLPGMSGAELVAHARKKNPTLPAIVMSGLEREFADDYLNGIEIEAYVQKPYRPDEVTDIILKTLWGDDAPESPLAALEQPRSDLHHAPLDDEIISRLTRLQNKTNAHQVILWALDGMMLYLYDESQRREAEKLAKPAISSITGGLEMLVRSGSAPSRLITVLDGDPYEIVLAHVRGNWDYCLAIIVDGEKRGTKLSTVWGAMQRTVADLSVRLTSDPTQTPAPAPEASAPAAVAAESVPTQTLEEELLVEAVVEPAAPEPEPEPEIEADPIATDEQLENLIDGLGDDSDLSDDELDTFWETGLLSGTKSAEIAQAMADAENGEEPGVRDERWEVVKGMLGTQNDGDENLLSLEDAQEKGLLGDQEDI